MAELHTTVWGEGEPVVMVHGSLGWGTDTFESQRPLSDHFKLILVDRRGFGGSPATSRVDFDVDARDIAALLGEHPRAHLVGHSYGGVVSLLAAAQAPDRVRSLTVIEPPALGLLRGDPLAERMISALAAAIEQPTLEDFFFGFIGLQADEPRPALNWSDMDRAAIASSKAERQPWEAQIPLDALAAARFPKLVISGDWSNSDQRRRETRGVVFNKICDLIASRIGAERAIIPGATHNPQIQKAEEFNRVLRGFLERAQARGGK